MSSDAHSSVMTKALLEAKQAAWTQEQLSIAQRAEVPQCEHYGSASHSEHHHHDCNNNSNSSKPDPTFVHRWFALPDFDAALFSHLHDSSDASETRMPHLTPSWQGLLHQLRHDAAQQRPLSPGDGETSGDCTTMASATQSPPLPPLTYVGGVDISFIPNSEDGIACLAILRYPSMELVKTYMHRCTLREPYISTFLAFREIQPVCELFAKVRDEVMATATMPQLLLVDGNGVHHPRRCGLATHLGVVLGMPTIGCSKKILQVDGITRDAVEAAFLADEEEAEKEGGEEEKAGTSTLHLPAVLPLIGSTTGVAARTSPPLYGYAVHGQRNSVKKCIFVSPGHGVGFAVATALVVTMLRHRIPEPIRAADLGSRAFIRAAQGSESVQ